MFGCIADDLTGATDIAALLARRGLKVALIAGVPGESAGGEPADAPGDAIVIALKTRTVPAETAVAQSLAAARWLKAAGARSLYFKYCSTFDSTDWGNIGPVAVALADAWGCDRIIYNPAFPENGRTVYQGHLFVGDRLISATGMADHPLTPMRDPDLVAVLSRQVAGAPVGLIAQAALRVGPAAVAAAMTASQHAQPRHLICDSISDADLEVAAAGAAALAFATGGSAFGAAYAAARHDRAGEGADGSPLAFPQPAPDQRCVILAGSCSQATLRQIAALPDTVPRFLLDAEALAADPGLSARIAAAVLAAPPAATVLIASSAAPERLAAVQAALGREAAGALVERALGDIAARLFAGGERVFIVAGGETSGAVVAALGAPRLAIGPEIAPGVPWTHCALGGGLWLALKSGNFGGDRFFADAEENVRKDAP